MAKYRTALPQLGGGFFLADGGIETTLIFHDGLDLPEFAAFPLLLAADGTETLRRYFTPYAEVAARHRCGLVLESATWRASSGWGARLGHDDVALAEANRRAIHLLEEIRAAHESAETPIVISGCIGPRGDGYVPDRAMSAEEAVDYHRTQVATFAGTAADMVSAITMNYVEEAIGIAEAAREANMPAAIAFTVETTGALPTGQSLRAAVEAVDEATSGHPSYYMINCAHPTHFQDALDAGAWLDRLQGLRANASKKSHAELDESTEIDAGDPVELAAEYAALRKRLRRLNVMGGCCGTDHRHIACIAEACSPLFHDL